MDWFDLLAVQGILKSLLQHHSSKASILWCSAFFTVQLSHPYMTTGKTIALTRWTFVGKVISLLLDILSRLVITFFPRSKRLLISWLQYYISIKKKENLTSAARLIDLEGTRLSEISQTRKTNTIWYYVEPKMYNKLVNITKKKQTYRYGRRTSGYQWRDKGRDNIRLGEWEVETTGCKIGYKDVLYNTGDKTNIL